MEGALPPEGDLDGCCEAGGEQVSREVGVHGQQLAGLAGSQLDAVLHGGREGHLGQRVARVDGCHLDGHNSTVFLLVCLAGMIHVWKHVTPMCHMPTNKKNGLENIKSGDLLKLQ